MSLGKTHAIYIRKHTRFLSHLYYVIVLGRILTFEALEKKAIRKIAINREALSNDYTAIIKDYRDNYTLLKNHGQVNSCVIHVIKSINRKVHMLY